MDRQPAPPMSGMWFVRSKVCYFLDCPDEATHEVEFSACLVCYTACTRAYCPVHLELIKEAESIGRGVYCDFHDEADTDFDTAEDQRTLVLDIRELPA